MWRSKKFILIVLLATVVLAGSIGGVVLATDNGDKDKSPPEARFGTLLDKVCEIYNANPDRPGDIDCDLLKAAFAQAQSQMRDEAVDSRLANLVDQGKITQAEADQYKAWLQARPDMEPFQQQLREWQQARPDIPSELKEWQEARPDIPFGFGFGGRGGYHGFGGPYRPVE